MKKILLAFLSLGIVAHTFAAGEVTVAGSLGQDGTYNTLTAVGGAFAALNAANQAGRTITIAVSASTTGETGAIPLTGAAAAVAAAIDSATSGAKVVVVGNFAFNILM